MIKELQRRFALELHLEADDFESLLNELEDFKLKLMINKAEERLKAQPSIGGVMGGVKTGYRYRISCDQEMTSEAYHEMIQPVVESIKGGSQ